MTLYQQYSRLPIRFSELGLERGSEKSSYFCTPRGARVIGWAGVDGIHFCFVPGCGDMVFAVDPMAAGDYVQPVARSFADFLGLVLACGGSAAVEQACGWTREQFDSFLEEGDTDDPPRLDALNAIAGLGVTPVPDPYGYLAALREEFDARDLQPREVPATPAEEGAPFPVVWNSGLYCQPRRRRPAREVSVEARFSWGEELWYVPKLYVCGEGIVVDFCIAVEMQRVKDFLGRYAAQKESEWGAELPEEQSEEIERANPLHISFRTALTVDGRELRGKSGSSTCWVPAACGCEELFDNRQGRTLLDHYGLDESKAWVFWRENFPWSTRRAAPVRTAALHLVREKEAVTVARFTDPEVGQAVSFVHPATGAAHTLRVEEYEPQTLDTTGLRDRELTYPTHCTAITCAVEPPLADLALRDCARSDQPRGKTAGACAIGVFLSRGKRGPQAEGAAAYGVSALHFAPPRSITWRVVLHQKPVEDAEIPLF